jgi:hypothetical protein
LFQLAGQGSSGLQACLWVSAMLLLLTVIISFWLPAQTAATPRPS